MPMLIFYYFYHTRIHPTANAEKAVRRAPMCVAFCGNPSRAVVYPSPLSFGPAQVASLLAFSGYLAGIPACLQLPLTLHCAHGTGLTSGYAAEFAKPQDCIGHISMSAAAPPCGRFVSCDSSRSVASSREPQAGRSMPVYHHQPQPWCVPPLRAAALDSSAAAAMMALDGASLAHGVVVEGGIASWDAENLTEIVKRSPPRPAAVEVHSAD